MKPLCLTAWGMHEIQLEDIPPGYVLHHAFAAGVMHIRFVRVQAPVQLHTTRPQSPGVDIDAVHRKYEGEHHEQQPGPKD